MGLVDRLMGLVGGLCCQFRNLALSQVSAVWWVAVACWVGMSWAGGRGLNVDGWCLAGYYA